MEETERYKNVDFTEPLTRLLCSQLLNSINSLPEEQLKSANIETLVKNTVALTKAVAYKKNIDVKNNSILENGAEQFQSMLYDVMADERPELYKEIKKYLKEKSKQ